MEQLTVQDFENVLQQILQHKPEGHVEKPNEPPAQRELTLDLVKKLLQFIDSPQVEQQARVIALKTLGDAARIKNNRDFIGAMKPIPRIIALISSDKSTTAMGVRLIANMCFDHPYNREMLQQADGVKVIISVLQQAEGDSDEIQELQRILCGCVANIASATEEICVEIFKLGGAHNLIKLLSSPNDNVQCMAARALRNVCETEEIRMFTVHQGKVLSLAMQVIKSTFDDDSMLAEFVGLINALIATKTICADFIHEYKGISLLLTVLQRADDVNLIADVQDTLTGIAENDETRDLFSEYLPEITTILLTNSVKEEVRATAAKLYAVLSASEKLLPVIYSKLDSLMNLLYNDENKEVQKFVAMTLGNLARTDAYTSDMAKRGAITLLSTIVKNNDRDLQVRHYCISTLRNLALNSNNRLVILSSGVFPAAVQLLKTPNLNQVLVYQAIGLIRALLLGGENYAIAFVEAEGIPNMTELITFDSDHVKYEACRVIATLFREGWFVAQLLKANSLPALSSLLNSKFNVLKHEGATAIIQLLKDDSHKTTILQIQGIQEGLESVLKTFIATTPKLTAATTATQEVTKPKPEITDAERITEETVNSTLTVVKLLSPSPLSASFKDVLLELQQYLSGDLLKLAQEVFALL